MIHAVIGANYGDEGKGLVTDYLSGSGSLVVRFNGGAQAGHTVVTPEGRTHVFSHFGAGTLRGASTLLSRYFIVNPILFNHEWDHLTDHGSVQQVYVDPNARVTTPFDMLINRFLEEYRGHAKHGSCGIGINETVTRCEKYDARLTVAHLSEPTRKLRERLEHIGTAWWSFRTGVLGFSRPVPDLSLYIEKFIDDIERFNARVIVKIDSDVLQQYPDLIFEGAQGLRLDEFSKDYPYVTRSRTGIVNVLRLLNHADRHNEIVHAHYVTRVYLTRHGAGPLPHEVVGHPYRWSGPETNVDNPFQGPLRYAFLNPQVVLDGVVKDHDENCRPHTVRTSLVVTCVDQMQSSHADKTVEYMFGTLLPISLMSYGPTRHDVRAKKGLFL